MNYDAYDWKVYREKELNLSKDIIAGRNRMRKLSQLQSFQSKLDSLLDAHIAYRTAQGLRPEKMETLRQKRNDLRNDIEEDIKALIAKDEII